ncbi:MAG: phosphoribosyltransferase family protein [Anaerolineales bacterium]
MKEYLQLIETNTSGPRCDVTSLFANPVAFAQLVTDLSLPFTSTQIDYVAGIDALGFILGTAISIYLQKGFIPIRKEGKLPVDTVKKDFIDYSGKHKILELRKGLIREFANTLVVDEWIETGAQMQAAIELIEKEKGIVAGIATIDIDTNPIPQFLQKKYKCHAVWFDMKENV